jgi:hypothetical protein
MDLERVILCEILEKVIKINKKNLACRGKTTPMVFQLKKSPSHAG